MRVYLPAVGIIDVGPSVNTAAAHHFAAFYACAKSTIGWQDGDNDVGVRTQLCTRLWSEDDHQRRCD